VRFSLDFTDRTTCPSSIIGVSVIIMIIIIIIILSANELQGDAKYAL